MRKDDIKVVIFHYVDVMVSRGPRTMEHEWYGRHDCTRVGHIQMLRK